MLILIILKLNTNKFPKRHPDAVIEEERHRQAVTAWKA
jgi:hypothetical protein